MINLSNNKPLSELYEELGREWVDLNAAADLLEDCKGAFFSQRVQGYIIGDMAVNRAENLVKASREWQDYVEKTVNARKRANLAKVKLETIKMRFHELQSEEATERVKARL